MKVFWVLVGLLVLGAAVYLFAAERGRSGESSVGAVVPVPGTWEGRQTGAPTGAQMSDARERLGQARTDVKEIEASESSAPVSVAPPAVTPPAVAPVMPGDAPKPAEAVKSVVPKPAEQTKPSAAPAYAGPTGQARAGTPRLTSEAAPAGAPVADGAKGTDPLAAKIVTKEDGSLLVDGRFVVRGKGTAEEPYKVTWDQLLSAQDDYVPKEGRKKILGRISMLDGKWVEVTGYIAFPVMAESQDEALAMMNQWDGCCIGVPPTPYDAIEVRLKSPATGNARLTTYGAMKGQFKIDPHLVGGWLVGLYVMDSAAMTPQSYGGFAP